MKRDLEYFYINNEYGGNQDWFTNVVMYMGGCAAATACDSCIYFARTRGMEALYPYQAWNLTKQDYIKFAMEMKPYLRPRVGGISKLSIYEEGFSRYLNDIPADSRPDIRMNGFSGERTYEEARAFIKKQIDDAYPIPYLMLKHTENQFADYRWHWFLLVGYEETELDFRVKTATYGEAAVFSLQEMWDTGFEEKGGMIAYRIGCA